MARSSFTDAGSDGGEEPWDGELEWVVRAGGPYAYHEAGMGIDVFSNGDLLATGMHADGAIFGPGELEETKLRATPCHDMFIGRWSRDGELVWAKRVGALEESDFGSHNDGMYARVLDESGSFVIVGLFEGDVEVVFGENEPKQTAITPAGMTGASDLYLARFNGDGTLDWVKQAGGYSFDAPTDAWVSTSDHAMWIVGAFSWNATFGSGEENETILETQSSCYEGYYGKTMFLAKFDLDMGDLVWAKQAAGCSIPIGISGAADDGNLYVTGRFEETVTLGEGDDAVTFDSAGGIAIGGDDLFLARFVAESGELDWAVSAGGGGKDWGWSVAQLPDGSALVTGLFEGAATFRSADGSGEETITSNGDNGLFTARYTSSGDLIWIRTTDVDLTLHTGDVGAARLLPLDGGDYLVGGNYQGTAVFGMGEPTETTFASKGWTDIYIARFESNGDLVWARSEGGVGYHDMLAGMTLASDGAIVATGMFGATVVFGEGEPNETSLTADLEPDAEPDELWNDIFLMKLAIE